LRQGFKLAGLWFAGILLGSAALALGWRQFAAGDFLRVRSIQVKGLSRATAAEVLSLSPVREGANLLAADVDEMERAIARYPWIARATVRRRLPPAIEVTVVEREPRALVDLGGLYLVDRLGQVFKRAAPGDGLDLPLITGFSREDYLARPALLEPKLGAVLALIDDYGREGLGPLAFLQELHLDADGGVVLYVGDQGTEVYLGQGELPKKLTRLHRVLEALRAEGRRAEVIHLDDNSHPDRVAVRLSSRSTEKEGAGLGPAPAREEGAREGPGRRRGRDAPLARR
jgi:cell division protein FtsQ